MSNVKPTYGELEKKHVESEALVEALRKHEIDAIIGEDTVAVVRLREVEAQLIEAKKTAEQRANDLETFSYSVSHDLRNPLNAIIANTEALSMNLEPEPGSDTDMAMKHIINSALRMAQVINDLLTLSGISQRQIKCQKVNLSTMAETFLSELKATSPHGSIEFRIEPNISVDADSGLIRILIENLIRNAWKFTSKQENALIEFGVEGTQEQHTYFIRDNGVGFDMMHADRIFEPFQRLHSHAEFPGTGIGLAIVKRVIEKHGGKIWAESEPGKGAAFLFVIP